VPILLGLDTGGTYTDAVLFDPAAGVIASAKSLTTKHDLAIGLRGAVERVLPHLPEGTQPRDIALVSMSTTLATNAIVEGHGAPICLILVGYDAKALERANLKTALGGDPVIFIAGGHKPSGDEQAPLDLEAARAAILEHAPKVAAFAVSGYFSVRNPKHEIVLRDLIRELSDRPVSCGHELTSKLDAPRRALTCALNARLIPQLQQLIRAIGGLLHEQGIGAPLMVVKGDGSLMDSAVALACPVETILSGPAASLVGARHLSGEDTVIVSDMGGTTTDIAMLKHGRPVLNKEGATVGGWKTMVEAVAVHTYGLGGDSEVRLDDQLDFTLGPRRVVPLSLLAMQHPHVLDALRDQVSSDEMLTQRGAFALRQRPLDTGASGLSAGQQQVWDRLAEGPVALSDLIVGPAVARNLARLVDRGLVVISGLTPSDAAHALGLQTGWNVEAADLGARLFLRRSPQGGWKPPATAEQLCRDVVERAVQQSCQYIFDAVANDQAHINDHHWGALGRYLVHHAFAPASRAPSDLFGTEVKLRHPLLAIGAPVGSYYPEIARRLHTRLVIPKYAEVSNAVGAVAGGVSQRVIVTVTSPTEGRFRAHMASGIKDFGDLESACNHARDWASETAKGQARAAGAVDIELFHERDDKIFEQPGGMRIFIESTVTATAFGRPALATA